LEQESEEGFVALGAGPLPRAVPSSFEQRTKRGVREEQAAGLGEGAIAVEAQ
jgi:hypothetical protein